MSQKKTGNMPKILAKLGESGRLEVLSAMQTLHLKSTSTTLRSMLAKFDTLQGWDLVKEPVFSRKTGLPKLKKALTGKGRKAFKYLFPSESKKEAPPAPPKANTVRV